MKRLKIIFWHWWYKIRPVPSRFTRPEALAIARKYNLDSDGIILGLMSRAK